MGCGLVLALIGACSSGSSSGGGSGAAATPADVQAACSALCDHESRCGSGGAPCVSEFTAAQRAAGLVRQDFTQAYTACMNGADCSKNADACVAEALGEINPDWQQDPARKQCLDRRTVCNSSFGDDICGDVTYMTDAGRKQVAACLDKACDAVSACLDGL
jgi:hypothetical protein